MGFPICIIIIETVVFWDPIKGSCFLQVAIRRALTANFREIAAEVHLLLLVRRLGVQALASHGPTRSCPFLISSQLLAVESPRPKPQTPPAQTLKPYRYIETD